jgi:hypothetical protein
VKSTGGNAFGIVLGEASTFALNNNVSATAAAGKQSAGVVAEKATDITIGGNVDIVADGGKGIHVKDGNLTLNFAQNANLDLTGATSGGIHLQNGNLILQNGTGATGWTADLGVVILDKDGTLSITGGGKDNSYVSINLSESVLVMADKGKVGTLSNVTLGVYANKDIANTVGKAWDFTVTNYGTTEHIERDPRPGNRGEFIVEVLNASTVRVTFERISEMEGAAEAYLAALGMHRRYTAWNAVRNHLISGSGNGILSGYRGQVDCDPCENVLYDPCGLFANSGNRNTWVNYVGRADSYASPFHGANWKVGMGGIQVGSDLFRTNKTQFGMLFGYEGGKAAVVQDRVNVDDVYLGVYGTHILRNGADIRGVFAYGWQDYNMNRFSADENTYTSKFRGYTTESTLEIGKRFSRGAWSLRPVAGVDVMTRNLYAAKETSSSNGVDALDYDKTDLTQVFFRTGTELRYQMKGFTLNSGVFYAYDTNGVKMQTSARDYQGSGQAFHMEGVNLGRELLTYNIGASRQLGKNFTLFGGYDGEYVVDTKLAQHAGYVGGAWRW